MDEQLDFRILPGHQFVRTQSGVPELPGIYAIFLRNADRLLNAMGYGQLGGGALWEVSDRHVHLYSGGAADLRYRLRQHVLGGVAVSTLRRSLFAAEAHYGALSASGLGWPAHSVPEVALDILMMQHTIIGFRRCTDYVEQEAEVLNLLASPFNIQGRQTPFSKRLQGIRALYDGRVPREFCREHVG